MEERILIVDDDERISSILAQRLTREGHSCLTASNGREALQQFSKEDFSLILSDIKMPEMNGLELLKEVKVVDSKMLVILITGYPEIDLAVQALRVGAYDFIIKPFDLDLVAFSVKRALEKKRMEEEIETYHDSLEKMVEERTAELRLSYRLLQNAHLDSVKLLIEAIEAKDRYTRGHSDRVRKMSLKLAMNLGVNDEKLEDLEYGALLHDIGKIGIRDEVLRKQGHLSPEEFQHVQEHPLIGVKILEGIDFFKGQLPMIRHHHEHFDGGGYPDRLIGQKIPLEARIIAVADAFDAMTSLRPHRTTMTLADTLTEMKKLSGKQFDPHILEIFLKRRAYNSDLECPKGEKDLYSSRFSGDSLPRHLHFNN